MARDIGDARRVQRRRWNPAAVISLSVVAAGLIFFAWFWHKEWGGTGTARNVGAHIYQQLLAIEPDVLSGKITDPNDPRLEAVEKEISTFQKAHPDSSFTDGMLFSSLSGYEGTLGSMAMANSSPAPSVARGQDLMILKQNKADVEKYLK